MPIAANVVASSRRWEVGMARTRAKDDVTCSVSDEIAPSLAANCSLAAGVFFVLFLFF